MQTADDNPAEILIDPMLVVAEMWATQSGRALTALGDRVLSSSQFFVRVRNGRDFTVRNYSRMMAWLADPANWGDEGMPIAARRVIESLPHGYHLSVAAPDLSPGNLATECPPGQRDAACDRIDRAIHGAPVNRDAA
jgi:hypothetical protein